MTNKCPLTKVIFAFIKNKTKKIYSLELFNLLKIKCWIDKELKTDNRKNKHRTTCRFSSFFCIVFFIPNCFIANIIISLMSQMETMMEKISNLKTIKNSRIDSLVNRFRKIISVIREKKNYWWVIRSIAQLIGKWKPTKTPNIIVSRLMINENSKNI